MENEEKDKNNRNFSHDDFVYLVERKKEGNACEKMDESNICDDIRVLDISFHGRYNTRTSAN
jgi:hypothetical protein